MEFCDRPDLLFNGLMCSHSLVSAWIGEKLIGIGNAISDGHLVVYYPHLLVHPAYHRKGIGRMIMQRMAEKYRDFHMQMLTADPEAIPFYQEMGVSFAGKTKPMWKFEGLEHS